MLARLMLGAVAALCPAVQAVAEEASTREVDAAFERLVEADDWRDTGKARDELAAFGARALPAVLAGTQHEAKSVREACFQILFDKFPHEAKAIDAMIQGLKDKDQSIRYECAFYLGSTGAGRAKAPLKACIEQKENPSTVKYAAAKSLAEIGDGTFLAMLYIGLGSNEPYPRYLSNIGIKALTGKDLSDFGYEGPWEGAMVSGPRVYNVIGNPLEKAEKNLHRWEAVIAFLKWLKVNRPDLYATLEDSWL